MMPRALALRVSKSSVSPSRPSCLATSETSWWNAVRSAVSPAASSQEVPANSPGARVGEGDVPLRLGGVLLLGLLLRREPGGGERDQPLDGRDPEAVDAGGELLVDPAGRLVGQGASVVGHPAGLVRRHGARLHLAHSSGNRCRRSRASAINDIADWVETPIAAPSSSATNAAHRGVPSPPREASQSPSPGRPVSPQVAVPDSAVAGCARTTRRRCGACGAGPPVPPLGLGGSREQAGVVEVLDLDRRCADCLHGPTQPETTDIGMARKPLSTRDRAVSRRSLRDLLNSRDRAGRGPPAVQNCRHAAPSRACPVGATGEPFQRQPSSGATWRSTLSSTCAL